MYCTGIDKNRRRIYTPEREAIHQEIVRQALCWNPKAKQEQVKQTNVENPFFMCVGGGMSVGMTYMQRLMMNEGFFDPDNTVLITPLSFLPLPEFAIRGHYQHPEKSPLLVDEYYDISRKIVEAAVARGLNVVYVDQADRKEAILDILQITKEAQYESAMMAVTMTPEAYHAASQLWLERYQRLTDHTRGFGDLQEFSSFWSEYTKAFDAVSLFETFFNTQNEALEYTVRSVMRTHRNDDGQLEEIVQDAVRYKEFQDRGRYLCANATTADQARARYPYIEAPQLPAYTGTMESGRQGNAPSDARRPERSLAERLEDFSDDDFETRFIQLVMATQGARARAVGQ
jgi:hypothetical protein